MLARTLLNLAICAGISHAFRSKVDELEANQSVDEAEVTDLEAKDSEGWTKPGTRRWTKDAEMVDVVVDRFYQDATAIDKVSYTFKATNLNRSVPDGLQKKVAYLFMVRDGMHQHKLWQKYFKDADPGSYSIYFHQYKNATADAEEQRTAWSEFGAQFIPNVRTGWSQLAGVEYALIWEALREPANAQMVLLSEGHVPLKSASYIHKYLLRESENSKICFNQPQKEFNGPKLELQKQCYHRDSLQNQKFMTTIKGKQKLVEGRVRKHHQWLVLSRRHAVDLIQEGRAALQIHLKALLRQDFMFVSADVATLGASDESYVATALLLASEKAGTARENSLEELDQNGVRSECTTFVYWRHCFQHTALGGKTGWNRSSIKNYYVATKKGIGMTMKDLTDGRTTPLKEWNDTPRDFGRTDSIPSETYLRNLVNTGLLFARKFGKDENGKLSKDYIEDLPQLWEEFESKMSPITDDMLANESRLWPALDVANWIVRLSAKARVPKPNRSHWRIKT